MGNLNLFVCLKGPDPLLGDDPNKLLSSDISNEEKKRIVFEYYEKLVQEYKKLRSPTGEKDAPAKTCKDLAIAHPTFLSGNWFSC